MGRLILVVLVIVTVIVLWKAFGPKTWNNPARGAQKGQFPPLGRQKSREVTTKGPDDDPDFLWNIKKERFKAQREAERLEQEAVERARRGEHGERRGNDAKDTSEQSKDVNPGSAPNGKNTQNGENRKDGEAEAS